MSKCELTGKRPVIKNLVSHSNIKTKSKSLPNVNYKRLFSTSLNRFFKLKIASSTLKSMEHQGGFDKYILSLDEKNLSKKASQIKNIVKRKLTATKSTSKAK